jgi:hypothetical protein
VHNYVTLFDSFYLSRGLAMHQSLLQHSTDFTLYIFPFDDTSERILNKLALENVIIVPLKDFETPELLKVKKERSKAEYCWTCTPSVISYVLERYKTRDCTYIDADLIFYSDPSVLISELDDHKCNVLITEHRFSFLAGLYEEKRAGRFCVQFMTFRNESSSLAVLDKWRLQCIDWCYARYEDGKFGDQKYLDEWPAQYSNVHILKNEGGGVAPWNLQKYKFRRENESVIGKFRKSGLSFDVVFYHFQYVKFLRDGTFDIGWYLISSQVKNIFYTSYIEVLRRIETNIVNMGMNYNTGFSNPASNGMKGIIKRILKKYFGYNTIKNVA